MPPTTESPPQAKKRKKDRACDGCRRRKTKCDGPWMPNNLCSNCIQTRKPCTYVEASKPRGPPKAYVTGLEDRLEALESLLQRVRPDVDFSEELGPPVQRNSWKSQDGPSTASSSNSATRKSSFTSNALPPLATPFQAHRNQPSTSNSIISPSPLSTHLKLHSQRGKRPRDPALFAYRDARDLSDEDSSSGSSSSSETEEIVITSLVGRTKITLQASENDDSAGDYNIRFHGRSSTAGLVEATRQFKYMHMRETMSPIEQENTSPISPDNSTVAQTRRPVFWQTPTWELAREGAPIDDPGALQKFLDHFPPPDLAEILVELYFRHSNSMFPLLHRPTFNRQWQEQLHHRNIWFACVCLSIFAIASRWCHDERVLPEKSPLPNGNTSRRITGRHYFEMAMEIHRVRRSLFHPASLFEVQSFTLMAMYLRGAATYPAAWIIVSTGIRKAQDVGAHRKRVYRGVPNIDDELWKRAFWHLVVFDRLAGAYLGRACGLAEEDFDLDLPLEVDDDYWEETQEGHGPFKQPSGVPSSVTAFNEFIKLTQIMAFAIRTLYAINKSQVYCGIIPLEREKLVKQLSLAMDEWEEGVPEHLRWQDKMDSSLFSAQSATLFTTFYLTRMLVHRPLAASSTPNSSFEKAPESASEFVAPISDPAILICSEAAGSCARIVDFQLQHGIHHFNVPNTIGVAHASAAFLLLSAWKLKVQERDLRRKGIVDIKPPLAQQIEQKVVDIKVFLRALEALKPRWEAVDSLLEELHESLHGLESEHSDARTSDSVGGNFKSNIRHSKSDPWLQMQSGSNAPQHSSQHEFPYTSPSIGRDHHPSRASASFKNYRPIADLELHTFSDAEPPVHVRLPQSHNGSNRLNDSDSGQWQPFGRSYPNVEPHSAPVPLNGRTRAISVTNAPWNERSLPFISSMRRTSHPNLSQRERESQHSNQAGVSQSRIPSQSLSAGAHSIFGDREAPVRYEDVNMHRDGDEFLANSGYVQRGYHQAPPSKYTSEASRGPYDKRGYHLEEGWIHPLPRNNLTDRTAPNAWTGLPTVSATSYPHSHYFSSSQDGQN